MVAVSDSESFSQWSRRITREFVTELRNAEFPITKKLLALITVIFGLQVMLALIGDGSVRDATAWLFLNYPKPTWFLSFFLHQGILHLLANIAIIGLLGAVIEPKFGRTRYWVLALSTGYISTAMYGLVMDKWTAQPTGTYGASGFGFALAGYFLWTISIDLDAPTFLTIEDCSSIQFVSGVISIAALIAVLVDPFTGMPFTPGWINFAHLVGFVLGVIVAGVRKTVFLSLPKPLS